jgi:exosortase B
MTISVTPPPSSAVQPNMPTRLDFGMLGLGFLLMYGPTVSRLSEQIWSQDGQGHGPVMLALVFWLMWQRKDAFISLPAVSLPFSGALLIVPACLLYALGASQGFPEFETASLIPLLVGVILLYKGWAGVRCLWFPILFLFVLIPLPGTIVQILTAPLKSGVSNVAESIMYHAGYPIGRAGVTLVVGQYKLLVADACAGLNSIFALEAIGVFYMSIVGHKNNLRNILLATLILPISFCSNVIRVVVLVLVTYYFGDAAGQGFVHGFAGILLFMVATALTILCDSAIGYFFKSRDAAVKSARVL